MREIKSLELGGNPFHMIGQDWMLITAEKDGKANTMTASWGGLGIMWNMDVVFTVVRPHRYTKEFLDASDHYSLSFFNGKHRKELNYLGSVSGRDEDKITKSGLTLVKNDLAPFFEEADKVFLVKKLFQQPLQEAAFLDQTILEKNYPNKDYHTLYIGKIEKLLSK